MQTPFDQTDADARLDDSLALLRELEANKPDEIRQQRADERIVIKSRILLQPGNAGDLHRMKVQGVTGDISRRGCLILVPSPLRVGDLYRLTFDRSSLDLPMAFARCLRCRLIREDAFESGFEFFTPVELSAGAVCRRAS